MAHLPGFHPIDIASHPSQRILARLAALERRLATQERNPGGDGGTGTVPAHTHSEYLPFTAFDIKGDLLVGTGSDAMSRLPVGLNGQVLVADSSQPTGLKWGTPSGGAVTQSEQISRAWRTQFSGTPAGGVHGSITVPVISGRRYWVDLSIHYQAIVVGTATQFWADFRLDGTYPETWGSNEVGYGLTQYQHGHWHYPYTYVETGASRNRVFDALTWQAAAGHYQILKGTLQVLEIRDGMTFTAGGGSGSKAFAMAVN